MLDLSGSRAQRWRQRLCFDTLHHLSVAGFLGNLVFLQTLFVETFGSNDALWSLTNEFFYYLMCGLTFYALSKEPQRACSAAHCCCCWAASPG